MFTGIVQEKGQVLSLVKVNEWWELTVSCTRVAHNVASGDSIATNGVCLTVTEFLLPSGGKPGWYKAKLLPETLKCTNLGALKQGDLVNLERAVAFGGHMDGHLVQGHVDQTSPILEVSNEQGAMTMRIALPAKYSECYLEKGWVTVDGVSLTIMRVDSISFYVSLVEVTQKSVVVKDKGELVNLEADSNAKIIAAMLPGMLQPKEMVETKMNKALDAIRSGEPVIVMDDYHRENEGDLIIAAEKITEKQTAFLIAHSTGIICTPLTAERAQKLNLPLMVEDNNDPNKTAFTVTVDAVNTGTGVSAADRTTTFHALAHPDSTRFTFRRPGHIFPLIARPGGVLERRGHTEASVDLCRLAGLTEVAVISELQKKDGTMYRLADCQRLGQKHNIPLISVDEIAQYRKLKGL